MTTVRALQSWFSVIKAWTTQRSRRKVAATDVIADVTQQATEDSVEAGFCGEPFADVDRTTHGRVN